MVYISWILFSSLALPPTAKPTDHDTQVSWQQLTFKASVFIFSNTTTIQLDTLDQSGYDTVKPAVWLKDQFVPSQFPIFRLSLESKLLGKKSLNQIYFEPSSYKTFLGIKTKGGRSRYQKTHVFSPDQAFLHRSEPENRKQRKLPSQYWTEIVNRNVTYPRVLVGRPVTDPIALFHFVSAVGPHALEETRELDCFTGREVIRITLKAVGTEKLRTRISENGKRHTKTIEALVIDVSATRFESADGGRFTLLGLDESIKIYLDPVKKRPLRVSGRSQTLGKVETNLVAVKTR